MKYFCGENCSDAPVLSNFVTTGFRPKESMAAIKSRILSQVSGSIKEKANACIAEAGTFVDRHGTFVFAWEGT